MRERSTDDLGQELMGAPNIDAYIHNNEAFFSEQSITESLAELYERKAVSKAALATRSSPGGAIPPGTGCCACASGWRPRWRRRSAC